MNVQFDNNQHNNFPTERVPRIEEDNTEQEIVVAMMQIMKPYRSRQQRMHALLGKHCGHCWKTLEIKMWLLLTALIGHLLFRFVGNKLLPEKQVFIYDLFVSKYIWSIPYLIIWHMIVIINIINGIGKIKSFPLLIKFISYIFFDTEI